MEKEDILEKVYETAKRYELKSGSCTPLHRAGPPAGAGPRGIPGRRRSAAHPALGNQ